jgi:hypothetical protein
MEVAWVPEHMKGRTLHPSLSSHHVLQKEGPLGTSRAGRRTANKIGGVADFEGIKANIPFVP